MVRLLSKTMVYWVWGVGREGSVRIWSPLDLELFFRHLGSVLWARIWNLWFRRFDFWLHGWLDSVCFWSVFYALLFIYLFSDWMFSKLLFLCSYILVHGCLDLFPMLPLLVHGCLEWTKYLPCSVLCCDWLLCWNLWWSKRLRA